MSPSTKLIEDDNYPFEFLSELAERESWRKEVHRRYLSRSQMVGKTPRLSVSRNTSWLRLAEHFPLER